MSMAGVGLPGIEMMLLQDRATVKVNCASPNEVKNNVNFAHKFLEIIVTQDNIDQRIALLKHSTTAQALVDQYKMNEGSLAFKKTADFVHKQK
ncbi:MAG: hypothetical protein K2P84_09575 [Undibacterium sp.]|nr:hypothetical protein [Undibacterium sp.]